MIVGKRASSNIGSTPTGRNCRMAGRAKTSARSGRCQRHDSNSAMPSSCRVSAAMSSWANSEGRSAAAKPTSSRARSCSPGKVSGSPARPRATSTTSAVFSERPAVGAADPAKVADTGGEGPSRTEKSAGFGGAGCDPPGPDRRRLQSAAGVGTACRPWPASGRRSAVRCRLSS